MTKDELKAVLSAHAEWIASDGKKGKRAYLCDANLSRANLSDANLCGATHVIDAGAPDGWRCVGWIHEGALRVRVGCRDVTILKGRKYWAGKSDRREVLA